MTYDELKLRLFDVINETEFLPIQDIVMDDHDDLINVYLTNSVRFSIRIENFGSWFLFNEPKP